MSISSMLGSDADRPQATTAASFHPSSSNPPATAGAMSPPQHTARTVSEYPYGPRSSTPDQLGMSGVLGARPHRSSSGSIIQRPSTYEDHAPRPVPQSPFQRHAESAHTSPGQSSVEVERARRTSIAGLVQRPNSQPHSNDVPTSKPSPFTPGRPVWLDQNNTISRPGQSSIDFGRRPSLGETKPEAPPPSRLPYDTRPPGFGTLSQNATLAASRPPQPSAEVAVTQLTSSGPSHQSSEPSASRGLNRILNDPVARPPEHQLVAVPMAQQDSAQSHSERSILGDRLERRPRLFSPFAGSVTSQAHSAPPEDQCRKGSDELSQHRALFGLTAESKRGRYSPLPQAVQGAQAQSVGPEVGIKTENGRVFSGIGGLASGPASPFKRDDGPPKLSEENVRKISQSTTSLSKRARKLKDEEGRASSEAGDLRGSSAGARGGKRARM